MNKALFFILFPIFVFLSYFNGSANSVVIKQTFPGSVAAFAAQQAGTHTVNLSKDDVPKVKNKVRIKAWDHFSDIDATEGWEPYTRIVYYNRAAYKAYQAYFLTAYFFEYNLRGPPAANA